ncbi:MAG: hypothetical protein K0S65_1060 [Labilithrix sp.]|nr:hypothetical protein [Labilithrix sp.]
MKPLRSLVLVLVASALGVVAACDETTRLPDLSAPGDGGLEADVATPESDGGIGDADARPDVRDAALDAAPSKCSLEGFCWTTLPPKQTLRDVWSDGLDSAWAVTEEGNVLRWDGASWAIHWTAPGPLFAVWGSGPTDLWVGGDSGLFHGQGSSASSITWTQVPFDDVTPARSVVDITGTGPSDIWVVGNRTDYSTFPAQLTSLVRHYTGGDPSSLEAWAFDPISYRPGLLRRMLVRPNGDAWMAGDWGGGYPPKPAYVLHRESVNGGDPTWVEQTVPYDSQYMFASVTGAGFVGNELRFLGMRDRSRVTTSWIGETAPGSSTVTWTEDTKPVSPDPYFMVWGTSKNDVYVGGISGRFRHFDGTAWMPVRISIDGLPVVNTFRAMEINPANELWVVGANIAMHKKFGP